MSKELEIKKAHCISAILKTARGKATTRAELKFRGLLTAVIARKVGVGFLFNGDDTPAGSADGGGVAGMTLEINWAVADVHFSIAGLKQEVDTRNAEVGSFEIHKQTKKGYVMGLTVTCRPNQFCAAAESLVLMGSGEGVLEVVVKQEQKPLPVKPPKGKSAPKPKAAKPALGAKVHSLHARKPKNGQKALPAPSVPDQKQAAAGEAKA